MSKVPHLLKGSALSDGEQQRLAEYASAHPRAPCTVRASITMRRSAGSRYRLPESRRDARVFWQAGGA